MLGIQEFLASYISDPWVIVAILGFMPFTEARGAILYGMYMHLDPMSVFAVSVAANILAIPFIFWFLNLSHVMPFVYKILGKRIERQIEENKEHFEKYEELALLIFVAVPIPGTGAWTGALLAEVLKLDRKKSFLVVAAGAIIAAAIIFFGAEFLGIAFGMLTKS